MFQENTFKESQKNLFISDGADATLNGYCMYFLRSDFRPKTVTHNVAPRTQTKRTLGEETFQREIMGGLINGW